MKTLAQIGEDRLLERLASALPRGANVRIGVGDDCAVTRLPGDTRHEGLLTSDAVLERVHFRSGASPEAVGRKAVARALSDIAAMGGEPAWLLVNLTLPPRTPAAFLDRFYRGFNRLAQQYGAAAVGGDLSRGHAIAVHVFAFGFAPRGRALLRSGARPGDLLYATGALGDSLRSERHLTFEPRLAEGRFLRRWASAAMDISDGLASDLPRLAARSGVGAVLRGAALPLAPSLARYARTATRLRHALCDGEDYELLFALPTKKQKAFERAWRRTFPLPCTAIGTVTNEKGRILLLNANGKLQPLPGSGYTHY